MTTDHPSPFRFEPAMLAAPRRPGISAFMRVRNGEDFVALAIESHLPHFDEIVVCHNRCTDGTVGILDELVRTHGDKLKVYEYEPRVHPAGSAQHRRTHWQSPNSLASFYNYSLARTTCQVALKLDDDHVAIDDGVTRITSLIRDADYRLDNRMICFSGINLLLRDGRLGALDYRPFAGHGDHWYFEVSPKTYFVQDRRFERFTKGRMRREYHGLAYWHLKYLKQGEGFANYELDNNPNSRYHKQYQAYRDRQHHIPFDALAATCQARVSASGKWLERLRRRVDDKQQLKLDRARSFDPVMAQRWLDSASPGLLARLDDTNLR